MSSSYLAGASAAHELARDAFDQGDALLGRRGPTNPPSRRSSGLTATSTRDVPVGTARPGGQLTAASHDRARPSRSAYDAVHHHYLNAAHLHHSGTPRGPGESPNETIARLPGALREALQSAHQEYQRDGASLDGVDEDALRERTERYLERLRDELEAWDPRVFGDREHPTDTSPTR